jgi:hypothetical protein
MIGNAMLRIVYYGPGLSGKTTNLMLLASALHDARVYAVSGKIDRELHVEGDLCRVDGSTLRVALRTEPG